MSKKLLEQYLTTTEAAEIAGMEYQTLLWNISHGNLKTIQPTGPTGKHFIFKAELDRFIESRKPKSRPLTNQELLFMDADDTAFLSEIQRELFRLQQQVAKLSSMIGDM